MAPTDRRGVSLPASTRSPVEIRRPRQARHQKHHDQQADTATKIGPKPVLSPTKPIADGAIRMPE